MAWVETGWTRSLQLQVTKTEAEGYYPSETIVYNGQDPFTHNGTPYPTLTNDDLQKIPLVDFEARVAAYRAYLVAEHPEITGIDTNELWDNTRLGALISLSLFTMTDPNLVADQRVSIDLGSLNIATGTPTSVPITVTIPYKYYTTDIGTPLYANHIITIPIGTLFGSNYNNGAIVGAYANHILDWVYPGSSVTVTSNNTYVVYAIYTNNLLHI